ncbi:Protein SDA1 like protein [Cyphomyrmex costatus]|uniref:Protein SDA1 homolog n=1 Tax=Cyphomyrmex costatus TaxID=456900 RepID=A0A195C3Q2_9HYME|nr:Protein SDA1 like protein [Cyphomyrmex costatus]
MVRHNNQLPDNLPQLQNLIKRDPESYKEEFLQQHLHYKSTLEVFHLEPTQFNKSLDELVTFLAQIRKNNIICREKIIARLYSLIGVADEPMPESIFVYGHMATGKSLIIQSLLDYLNYNVSYVNCIEHLGSKHLYNYILDDLITSIKELNGDTQSKYNCDNIMDFIIALKKISCNDKRPIVLVFDKCHKIRHFDVTFLPAILRLRELAGINICTILISEIVWDKFNTKIGTLRPIKIYFPQYTKDELAQLLLLDKSTNYDTDFYKSYLNLFLSVFFRFCRDLNELQHMAKINFAKYVEPIESKRIKPDNIAALWRNISATLRSNLEIIYLRVSTNDFLQPDYQMSREIESTTKLALSFELPFYAKYMLIAAYLASYNPAKYDKHIFMKQSSKKKKKIRSIKKTKEDAQKKCRVFTISRMLAIFCAILDEKVDINANLLAQISTMCQLGLLSIVGDNITQLDETKFKCCASHDFIFVVAKTVGFEIKNYLSANTVAHCYPNDLKTYPQEIIDILQTHNIILDNEMRMTFCKALIQLRNKSLLEPTALLINTVLQNFMFSMLKDPNVRAAKMSVDIMIELYNKNVWNDVKTVNVIATGCFSKITKVMVASLKFFLGTHSVEKESDDSDSDDEPNMKEIMIANKVNKKTKKRQKQLKKAKQSFIKAKKKKSKAPQYNFSALHLIHDPQDFAEKLFKQIEKNNDRFEVKLMTLDVVSRLIGLHSLFLLNFYPYIQRFLQPHQREVTKLLQFIAQASHELVPPDVLEPILKTLANNFITERNSADVMAIGLNTVREICTRCPLAMNEDLLEDLTRYKHYKERSVMMAAQSLIGTFRRIMPDLLCKKDRGRPTEANVMIKSSKYGEIRASEFVPGSEVLHNQSVENTEETNDTDKEAKISDEEISDEEVSDEEIDEDELTNESAKSSINENKDDKTLTLSHSENSILQKKNALTKQEKKAQKLEKKAKFKSEKNEELTAERKMKASVISTERLLTDKDFRKIDVALAKQDVTYIKRGVKRTHDKVEIDKSGELVKLSDIENIYKKRKHDKVARQKSVKKGQKGRDKFGFKDRRQNPLCSTTNREKRKGKAFSMLKQKLKTKVKRSFREKQIALKNHLIKQKRMK